jgi:lysylphosphatidylglycerol synthetase-like protein (DUF2156 family)
MDRVRNLRLEAIGSNFSWIASIVVLISARVCSMFSRIASGSSLVVGVMSLAATSRSRSVACATYSGGSP